QHQHIPLERGCSLPRDIVPDLHAYNTRSGSDCALPKLLSVEERLSTAFGRQHNSSPSGTTRLSRSLEDLPNDIKNHILKCQCSCDHLGYGNFSTTSLQRLT
ncbi:unnamed protein product, partial [Meganyctiphanes norvegica]